MFLAYSFPLRPVLCSLVFIFWPNGQENSFSPSEILKDSREVGSAPKAGAVSLQMWPFQAAQVWTSIC